MESSRALLALGSRSSGAVPTEMNVLVDGKDFSIHADGEQAPKVRLFFPDSSSSSNSNGSCVVGRALGTGNYGSVRKIRVTQKAAGAGETHYQFRTELSADADVSGHVLKQFTDPDIEEMEKEGALMPAPDASGSSNKRLLSGEPKVPVVESDVVECQLVAKNALLSRIKAILFRKQRERPRLLGDARREADHVRRYLGQAEVAEDRPHVSVLYSHHDDTVQLTYHPALALLMPKVPGITLRDVPDAYFSESFSVDRLFDLLERIVEELLDLHALCIVHLDINPANIMVDLGKKEKKGSVRIVDFGTAQHRSKKGHTLVRQEVCDTSSQYWRSSRMVSNPSLATDVFVGVEDDAFALARTLKYLLDRYMETVNAMPAVAVSPLITVLISCLEHIAQNINNRDGVKFRRPILLISELLSFISRLNIFDSATGFDALEPTQAIIEFTEARRQQEDFDKLFGATCGLSDLARRVLDDAAPKIDGYKQACSQGSGVGKEAVGSAAVVTALTDSSSAMSSSCGSADRAPHALPAGTCSVNGIFNVAALVRQNAINLWGGLPGTVAKK